MPIADRELEHIRRKQRELLDALLVAKRADRGSPTGFASGSRPEPLAGASFVRRRRLPLSHRFPDAGTSRI